MDYQARFEMIDSDAKKIAEDVYAEALKLKNPKVLHAVKHQPWQEYALFSEAMTKKENKEPDYKATKEAIKPIFKRLDDEIKDKDISFSKILEDDKLEVSETARNGKEALDFIESGLKVDIILLDIQMPYMNGVELLSKLNEKNIKNTTLIVSSIASKSAKETICSQDI